MNCLTLQPQLQQQAAACDHASAAAALELERVQQLTDRADAAATACKLQWEADVRSLEQQAAVAVAAAAAQRVS